MPFTAALASTVAEGDSPDDRGPAGLCKARGSLVSHATREYRHLARMQIDTESVFEWLKTADDHEALLELLDSHV